jgi:hypothetical protein
VYLPAPKAEDHGQSRGCYHYPYYYCTGPAPSKLSESVTGITWGKGGTISNRFEDGTQSNGAACQAGQEVEVDNLTGLMWVKSPTTTPYALVDVMKGIPASYCSYTDWRLPTINELLTLANIGAGEDGINIAMWLNYHGFSNVLQVDYWTSTPVSDSYNWVVSLGSGNTFYYPGHSIGGPANPLVWPVRGGQ